ncbi:hypothetical protein FHW20_001137 [Ochrobactrum intermedium]|uniref:Uncharacterized protein n=1 Tax=Brucella intermedia TaxID=94625 RepID=A0ABR6ALH3_9HYPH|nr:hypothetical protein [Brucella intermedia]
MHRRQLILFFLARNNLRACLISASIVTILISRCERA